MTTSWSPQDHVRHWMYADVGKVLSAEFPLLPARRLSVLDFGSQWFGDPDGGWATPMRSMLKVVLGGQMDHILATYPEYNIENLLPQIPPGATYDIVIADQVLEHVGKPWRAVAELARVVRPTGYVMVATPGLYPVHPSPLDCWRILHDGYRVLFPAHLWDYRTLGAWGSSAQLAYEIDSNGAFPYGPPTTTVEHAQAFQHYADAYDGRWPLMLWFVGRRRAAAIRGDEW